MPAPEGEVACGPLTIHLPSASEPTFWLMHDLAGLFGLDFNHEARTRLVSALRAAKVRAADVDHEADFVFVHAGSAKTMMATLRVLVERAPGAFAGVDLATVEAALRAWKRPKPIPFDVCDVFAVPLDGERFGAAQVVCFPQAHDGWRGSPLVVALDLPAQPLDALREAVTAGRGKPMAVREVLDTEMLSGAWPNLGARPLPDVDVARLVRQEKGRSGPVESILRACLGVVPWETYEPHPHEPHLLEGVVPPRKRNRRSVFLHRVDEVFGAGHREAPTSGPATLHILIAYRGSARDVPMLEVPKLGTMRWEMETRQRPDLPPEEACVGGGFDGFLDVFVHVAEVGPALAHLDQVAASLEIRKDYLVESYPPFTFDWNGTLRRMA